MKYSTLECPSSGRRSKPSYELSYPMYTPINNFSRYRCTPPYGSSYIDIPSKSYVVQTNRGVNDGVKEREANNIVFDDIYSPFDSAFSSSSTSSVSSCGSSSYVRLPISPRHQKSTTYSPFSSNFTSRNNTYGVINDKAHRESNTNDVSYLYPRTSYTSNSNILSNLSHFSSQDEEDCCDKNTDQHSKISSNDDEFANTHIASPPSLTTTKKLGGSTTSSAHRFNRGKYRVNPKSKSKLSLTSSSPSSSTPSEITRGNYGSGSISFIPIIVKRDYNLEKYSPTLPTLQSYKMRSKSWSRVMDARDDRDHYGYEATSRRFANEGLGNNKISFEVKDYVAKGDSPHNKPLTTVNENSNRASFGSFCESNNDGISLSHLPFGVRDKLSNFNVKDVKGDGGCYYRCLSLHFTGSQNNYMKYRREVLEYIRQHLDTYSSMIRSESLNTLDYFNRKTRSDRQDWAETTEIIATCVVFNINVHILGVVPGRRATWQWLHFDPSIGTGRPSMTNQDIYLYNQGSVHFMLCVPQK